jgi:hypothetical protein
VGDDSRLTVLAFDMGVTTGWAWFSLDQETLLNNDNGLSTGRKLRSGERDCGEIDGRAANGQGGRKPSSPWVAWDNATVTRCVEKVRSVWIEAEVDASLDVFVVVLEDFVLRTSDSARHTLSPVRLNAAFEYELRDSGVQIVKNSASDAMNVITDARLKGWGLYEETATGYGGRQHARDATRHAALTVRKWVSSPPFRGSLVRGLYGV